MGTDNNNKMKTLMRKYLNLGLEVVPLVYNTKKPRIKGYLDKSIEEIWSQVNTYKLFNIGIRLGKVADLENDCKDFGVILDTLLDKLGINNYPKYKSQRGVHRLLIVDNAPEKLTLTHWNHNQSNKKEHAGELRLKRCQSVFPESIVEGFRYKWLDGSDKYLNNIPHIDWNDIKHLTKRRKSGKIKGLLDDSHKLYNVITINPERWVFELFDILRFAKKGEPITCDEKTYDSRSEAEAAIVTRLISCGWDYDSIEHEFEEHQPGHYMEDKTNRLARLRVLFNKIMTSGFRPSIEKEHSKIKTYYQKDKVYSVLLSLAYQMNTNKVFRTYRDLAKDTSVENNESISGPRKACLKLEQEGKIKIHQGKRFQDKGKRLSTSFTLLHISKVG
jgi:hypothetical protein